MSVDIGEIAERIGRTPLRAVIDPHRFGLVALSVEDLERHGLRLIHDPLAENEAHGNVMAAAGRDFPSSVKKDLAKRARWVIKPGDLEPLRPPE